MPWGYPRRWLAATESTNDVARDWALAGAEAGALVVAAQQSRGRGRRARPWQSLPAAGVYASFILRPDWPAAQAPGLAILGAMAAHDALHAAGVPELRVKGPNDVQARGQKICGVLVEPRLGAGRIEFAVVGIGINVAQARGDFPAELQDRVTSCRLQGCQISVDEMLELLVESLRRVVQAPLADVRARWLAAGAREDEPEL